MTADIFEFFKFNTKLPEMAMLASKDFTAAKKVTSSGARADDQWIKNLILIHLSYPQSFKLIHTLVTAIRFLQSCVKVKGTEKFSQVKFNLEPEISFSISTASWFFEENQFEEYEQVI